MATLLGRMPGNTFQQEMARDIATLPMRLGGLGSVSDTNGPSSVLGIVG